jgi:hypothetical protein
MNFYQIIFVKAPSYRKVLSEVVMADDKRAACIALRKKEGKNKIQILEISKLKR